MHPYLPAPLISHCSCSTCDNSRAHHLEKWALTSFVFSLWWPHLIQTRDHRLSLIVRIQLMHRLKSQPTTIGGASVERRHRAALPTENCFELRDRSASVGSAGCSDFADAMSGSGYTRQTTRCPKFIAE